MPIYEYVCASCKSKFELLRSISQASEGAECPECHSQAERVLSGFACRSKDASGAISDVAGTGSACGSCTASTCSTCGL